MLASDRPSPVRLLAIGVSVLAHALLFWLVLRIVFQTTERPAPLAVTLVHVPPPAIPRPPPPPPPPKPPPAKPKPVTRPVLPASPPPAPVPLRRAAPRPVTAARPNRIVPRPAPARRPIARTAPVGPPVMHFGAADESGLGLDLGTPSGGGGSGHGSIDAFDEAVKRRIQSMKTYPPGLPYMPMECIVEYRVSVDRNGNMIDYRLTGCGNAFLDSATRAAILKAAPFARPPDFGGNRYDVYGTMIYLKQH